jgi:hypothetical protein
MENAAMNRTYFVSAPHTVEECMHVLDETKEKGADYLSKLKFGCMSGDHSFYTFIEAPSEDDVRKMLPKDLQGKAKIEKVDTFTPKQIEEMHRTMH